MNVREKILIIEDADALRKDIVETLTYEGFEVRGAVDGVEGVQVAREYLPDLIICDIMMPNLDGYGVLEELQKDGAGTTIPFIFLTALSDKGEVRQGMELGADDYVTKPFTVSELVNTVKRRLQKRTVIREKTEEKLDELRDNIIMALPHELRTPLTGILGFADILATDSPVLAPVKVAELAKYIHTAAQRLYRLTENYVVYAQLEALRNDQPRIQAMRSFMAMAPRMIIENMAYRRAQHYRREGDLEFNLVDDVSIQIIDDNLKKIVEELVDNAFKFSRPGTKVQIEGFHDGAIYTLRVTDHGRGMNQAKREEVGAFMQFERKQYEQQGTGFGLAIVQRLAEMHQGTFTLTSAVNQGTQVTITLPAVTKSQGVMEVF
jgi:two-component system, sensor histidine kinase and response regulator